MRLSENVVAQRIGDDEIVLVDDQTGAEIVLSRELWPLLAVAVTYLTGDVAGVQLGVHEHEFKRSLCGYALTGQKVYVQKCDCGAVAGDIGGQE